MISEQGLQCLQDLDDKNVKVKYITTDCDSRAANAAQQMYEEARYKKIRKQMLCGFALDVRSRCAKEYRVASQNI